MILLNKELVLLHFYIFSFSVNPLASLASLHIPKTCTASFFSASWYCFHSALHLKCDKNRLISPYIQAPHKYVYIFSNILYIICIIKHLFKLRRLASLNYFSVKKHACRKISMTCKIVLRHMNYYPVIVFFYSWWQKWTEYDSKRAGASVSHAVSGKFRKICSTDS